jgi:hypothetical protein
MERTHLGLYVNAFPHLGLAIHLSQSIDLHIINHSQTTSMPITSLLNLIRATRMCGSAGNASDKYSGRARVLSQVSRDFLQSLQTSRNITLN